jgi:mono/diheme cytochrome c family protein
MDPRHSHGPDRVDYRESSQDITEVHSAIQREHRDPSADVTPIPMWLAGICAGALVWGAAYFGIFHGGMSATIFNERLSSPDLLFPQTADASAGGADAGAAPAATGPEALIADGKKQYAAICAACHTPSGAGVPGAFPTLIGTEYVVGPPERLIAIMLKGVAGPLTVDGKQYNSAMPGQGMVLNDKKVAAIASYVRHEFGKGASPVTPELSAETRKKFASRNDPWSEAELKAFPAGDAGEAAPAAQ